MNRLAVAVLASLLLCGCATYETKAVPVIVLSTGQDYDPFGLTPRCNMIIQYGVAVFEVTPSTALCNASRSGQQIGLKVQYKDGEVYNTSLRLTIIPKTEE